MNITLPLKEMTVEEKLQLMEAIWEDLSQHAAQIPPPAWHAEELAARAATLARLLSFIQRTHSRSNLSLRRDGRKH